MRKREREREENNTKKVHRTNNGGSEVKEKEKERAFSEHTQEAFSALRDARGVGVAGVGVACRAWSRVRLVVVVATSSSLFTEHTGCLVDWLVRLLVSVLGRVYVRRRA